MTPPRQKRDKQMKFGAMLAIFLSAALCAHAGQSHQENAQKCSDSLCPLPASGEATLSVVSPVPETAIEPMAAAPRLKSLNGKTIAQSSSCDTSTAWATPNAPPRLGLLKRRHRYAMSGRWNACSKNSWRSHASGRTDCRPAPSCGGA